MKRDTDEQFWARMWDALAAHECQHPTMLDHECRCPIGHDHPAAH